MPDEKTPAIDHVLETTLAQCKSLLGEKTYTYTKSLAIDHADIEKMVEEGRGRCTVTLGDMSGTRFERSTAINYEMIVAIVLQIPVESDEYDWQLQYLRHMQTLIEGFLGKSLRIGERPIVKYSCGTKDLPGAVHQHDIDESSVDEASCFRGSVVFLVHIEQ